MRMLTHLLEGLRFGALFFPLAGADLNPSAASLNSDDNKVSR
jgi:hypothetical protein